MDNIYSCMFIGDCIKDNINKPHQIVDGFTFKKASKDIIEYIKDGISNKLMDLNYTERYESSLVINKKGTVSFKKLDFKYWKYYIIEFINTPENSKKALSLNKSLLLSDLDLTILCNVNYIKNEESEEKLSVGESPQIVHNFFINDILGEKEKEINMSNLKEVKSIFKLVEKIENQSFDYPYIIKSIRDFCSLITIPQSTPIKFVAIFSIIEALLADGENISGQLKSKINLLNNRFKQKIDIQEFFPKCGDCSLEKIVEKLYKLRSKIAHGDMADFNNELHILANHKQAYIFSYVLLKKLIIQSLIEPQLLVDLKKC